MKEILYKTIARNRGNNLLQKVLLLLIISLVFATTSRKTLAGEPFADTSPCQCHQDIIDAELSKTYVHLPFLQQQCSLCHVVGSKVAEAVDNSPPQEPLRKEKKRTRWFYYTASPATENWFFVPADLAGKENLVVSASDGAGKSHKDTLELPALETLQVKETELELPVIQSTEVRGVYRLGFITARIGWSTDKMADSEVRYGIGDLRNSAKEDALVFDHEIVLQNLEADQQYQYIVKSRDIFGNSVVSETGSFTTENPSPPPRVALEQRQEVEILLDAQFFRNEDSYLVKITTNQPAIFKVGRVAVDNVKKQQPATAIMQVADVVIPAEPGHPSLRSMDEISTSVCKQCHAKMFTNGNHAVNTGPSLGMIFPANYSTDKSGHLTCITCHAPHSSNFEYMTVNTHNLELCLGCHIGYDQSPAIKAMPLIMASQRF